MECDVTNGIKSQAWKNLKSSTSLQSHGVPLAQIPCCLIASVRVSRLSLSSTPQVKSTSHVATKHINFNPKIDICKQTMKNWVSHCRRLSQLWPKLKLKPEHLLLIEAYRIHQITIVWIRTNYSQISTVLCLWKKTMLPEFCKCVSVVLPWL